MDSKLIAVVITIAFSVVGVLGDYFLEAGERQGTVAQVGVVIFRESLNLAEFLGLGMAIAALILLVRFA